MVDELLLFLLRSGAHGGPVRLTTTEMGEMLGMSQQNVSRRLRLLEKEGMVERKQAGLLLTEGGVSELRELLALLQNSFDAGLEMSGRIVDGLGEGKFYLSKSGYRRQIREKLGFEPFPGTLNVKLDAGGAGRKRRLLQMEPVVINGFREEGRAFGDLFAYAARVDGLECAVVVPMRTHHGSDVIELMAPMNLRSRLGKKTGAKVRLKI